MDKADGLNKSWFALLNFPVVWILTPFYISYESSDLIFLYDLCSHLCATLLQDWAEFALHLLFWFIWPFSFLFYSVVYVLICSHGKSFVGK